MCVGTRMHAQVWKSTVRGHWFSPFTVWLWGSNSDGQAWQQVPSQLCTIPHVGVFETEGGGSSITEL